MNSTATPLVLTIGHSNRTLEEFIELLQLNDVQLVADVRTVPRSRYNPQFNRDALPESLRKAGIGYIHISELGGFRHTVSDSVNMGWRNASFRGFADYMQTEGFKEGLEKLIDLARTKRVALMCAEAVPWRCHRSLIADALLIRGIRVEDILGKGERREHVLTPWAEVEGTTITYPPSENL